MSAFVRTTGILALGLSAAACSSFGPQEIYNRKGLIQDPVAKSLNSPYWIFEARARQALRTNAPQDLAAMHEAGFYLVKVNCSAFYRQMGVNERRSRVARNLLSPISTIISGVLALHDWSDHTNQKEDILQIITLGTAAGATALDVYDEHFLFKSANIDSVRTMTMKELEAEKKEPGAPELGDIMGVISTLMDYENMCTPSHIVVRARKQIEGDTSAGD